MKNILIGVSVIAAIGGSLLFLKGSSKNTVKGVSSIKNITANELSQHSSEGDCWTAIDGTVYDITKFIPLHPGGNVILGGCGKDATDMFNSSGNGGKPHSQGARQILLSLVKVGVLVAFSNPH